MTTKLERLDSEVVYYNFVAEGPVYGRAVLIQEKSFDVLLSVARAAAELPPGFLYSLANDMRRRGGPVEMPLADAIEAVAKAIAPLLEEVRG